MALVVGDVIELKVFCQQTDQLGVNVRHYKVTAINGIGQTEQAVADDLSFTLAGLYKPVLTSSAKFFGVQLSVKDLALFVPKATSTSGQGFGTAGAQPLPRQDSGIISLRTAAAGRKNRGRAYIPFPDSTSNAITAIPTAAYMTGLDSIGNVFLARTSGAGGNNVVLQGVVYHRSDRTTTDLATRLTRSKWATQRRRGSFGQSNGDPF